MAWWFSSVKLVGCTSKTGGKNSESLNVILLTVIFSKRRKISTTLNRTQLTPPKVWMRSYPSEKQLWVMIWSINKLHTQGQDIQTRVLPLVGWVRVGASARPTLSKITYLGMHLSTSDTESQSQRAMTCSSVCARPH
jgi:hypothetical protein